MLPPERGGVGQGKQITIIFETIEQMYLTWVIFMNLPLYVDSLHNWGFKIIDSINLPHRISQKLLDGLVLLVRDKY